jgi:hypothetical protein
MAGEVVGALASILWQSSKTLFARWCGLVPRDQIYSEGGAICPSAFSCEEPPERELSGVRTTRF